MNLNLPQEGKIKVVKVIIRLGMEISTGSIFQQIARVIIVRIRV